MKKIIFLLTTITFFAMACKNHSFPTSNMGFFGEEWFPTSEVLCNGSGFGFGTCIAKQMKDSTCIGIAKFNGSHIAVEIPCDVMFSTAIDTLEFSDGL